MTDKALRDLAIAYVARYILIVVIERYKLPRGTPMSPMDEFLTAPICWGFATHDVLAGYVRGRVSRVERSESPVTFWINIGFHVLAGLLFFGSGRQGRLSVNCHFLYHPAPPVATKLPRLWAPQNSPHLS